ATFGSAARAIVPSGPLTEIWPAAMLTSTPFGTAIGYLAMRDMGPPLRHDAEDFAADAVGASLAIGHDAARGGQDRHAQAVHHARDVAAALVDAQPRLRDALEALDDGLAGVVLEADAQLLHRAVFAQREILDVALGFEDLRDRGLQLGSRHRHFRVPDHLGVADADQHVGNGIG